MESSTSKVGLLLQEHPLDVVLMDASPSDAKDVAHLADSIDIAKVENLLEEGFLAANYTTEDYRRFIEIADYSFTLRNSVTNELIAFLVAYKSERVEKKDDFNMYVRQNICNCFVTVRQIFVSPKKEHRRKGYASLMYRELYNRILENENHSKREGKCAGDDGPRPIFADIVKTPVNVPSRDFHLRSGFEVVGEMTRSKDNRQILIFCKTQIK